VYNVGAGNERPNTEIARAILERLDKPATLVRHVTDRLGHDRRYAIDATLLTSELGWKPGWTFEVGIAHTIDWYRGHRAWWEAVKSGSYRDYYERAYGARLRAAERHDHVSGAGER
jgi:dTDP-glucose 4,6-dehydratase